MLPGRIALRYLRSKKSHGAVSAIAAVSVAGVAIATAAVVCVLSVFNGFREVLADRLDLLTPELVISPAKGKAIPDADALADRLRNLPQVETASPSITEKALAMAAGRELPVTMRGVVTDDFRKITSIDSIIIAGNPFPDSYNHTDAEEDIPDFETYEDYERYMESHKRDIAPAIASIGVAARLGNILPGTHVVLFLPRREGRLNPSNPTSSFLVDSVAMTGVYESRQSDYDEDMLVVPLATARALMQYSSQASQIDLKASPGNSTEEMSRAVSECLDSIGDYGCGGFTLRDRMQMQEVSFRMVNVEKWVSFLLLFFILVIASFNIITTMAMLVLEKKRQMSILNALGMTRFRIGSIFAWESVVVSLIGAVAGIAVGLALCSLQQHFGLIRLSGDPESLLMTAYPVKVVFTDILWVLLPTAVIALATASITHAFAKNRTVSTL